MADNDIAVMAHLMRRAGFGAQYHELERRAAKGYEATVPMEPVNPVSHSSRRSLAGMYSPMCSSAWGTMKPSSPVATKYSIR